MRSFFRNSLAISAALIVLPAWFFPAASQAHRTWLMPSAGQVNGKDVYVTVDAATSDDLFQFDSFAAKLDGLTIATPDGRSLAPENMITGHLRSSFDLKLSVAGTYRISLVSDTVMASYNQGGEVRRYRGTAADFTKAIPADATDLQTSHMISRVETFVTADKATDSVLKPVGAGLEILPLGNPNTYVAGDKAAFRAWLDGKPMAGLDVSVIPGGVRYRGALKEAVYTTDAKGEFSVTWPAGQVYWVGASYPPRPAQAESGEAKASDSQKGQPTVNPPAQRWSYAATFDVLPF